MTNLAGYSNIYADLAQSAYQDRRNLSGIRYNFANGLNPGQCQGRHQNYRARFWCFLWQK